MAKSDKQQTRGTDKRSPLYTPKALAAIKKAATTRDLDGAYRYGSRRLDYDWEKEAA